MNVSVWQLFLLLSCLPVNVLYCDFYLQYLDYYLSVGVQ